MLAMAKEEHLEEKDITLCMLLDKGVHYSPEI